MTNEFRQDFFKENQFNFYLTLIRMGILGVCFRVGVEEGIKLPPA